jgi:hypothetical protein
MTYQFPSKAIADAKARLYSHGQLVEQATWQSTKSPDNTIEILNHSFGFVIPEDASTLASEVKPNLPWAKEHFDERMSGIPYNPPPSHERWPFNQNKNDKFRKEEKFSHTYPERFWPKQDPFDGVGASIRKGIRFDYGDFQDMVGLLIKDPSTRQAYLPIWFPEDLNAATQGERVPCTLGYHFIIRNNMLHLNYYIRSCDIIRHFRDDIFMACMMVYTVLGELANNDRKGFRPGIFTMYITSLHCFKNDKELLKNQKY